MTPDENRAADAWRRRMLRNPATVAYSGWILGYYVETTGPPEFQVTKVIDNAGSQEDARQYMIGRNDDFEAMDS